MASSSQATALTCPKPLDKHRGIFSRHLSTATDSRVEDWAKANNTEIAYTPTNCSWLNRVVRHEVACDEWYSSKGDRLMSVT